MQVDEERGYIDLSKKRVDPEDVVHMEEKWNKSKAVHSIMRHLAEALSGRIAVCHTHFDRASITRACTLRSIEPPATTWLDTARVSRRTWLQFAGRGYGLSNIANHLGISYVEHDALEDARAAGEILIRAIGESGRSLEEWVKLSRQPIMGNAAFGLAMEKPEPNPEGHLFGEVVVFTGKLNLLRREAEVLACSVGCEVTKGVTKKTTLVVVGDQDEWRLAGYKRSRKQRRAEELIAQGRELRIMGETDFLAAVKI
jgi:DNA polymerase-3 subunit epsilon